MGVGLLNHYADEFRSGRQVGAKELPSLFESLINTSDEEAIIALLAAWTDKGFTEDELFGLSTVMRERMVRVATGRLPLLDVVGTGGARNKTFNVSTAAAFVIAGANFAVAKHGNRAATSRAGSTDVLDQLRISNEHSPEQLTERLGRDGICFIFAPNHHTLSPSLSAARRRLGKPSIFNSVGPLCNPALPTNSLIGVSRREWLLPMANVLARQGTDRSWVVHAKSGLDEITLYGTTLVAQVENGTVSQLEINPSDFGAAVSGDGIPEGCDAARSAELIEAILEGELLGADAETLVLMNAAAAIYTTGGTTELTDAFAAARESIRSGAAASKLRAAREQS